MAFRARLKRESIGKELHSGLIKEVHTYSTRGGSMLRGGMRGTKQVFGSKSSRGAGARGQRLWNEDLTVCRVRGRGGEDTLLKEGLASHVVEEEVRR
jgi:hypothetical protein